MKKVSSYEYKENKTYDLNRKNEFIYIKYYDFKTHILKNGVIDKYKKV